MDKENTDSVLDLAVNKVSEGFKKVENSVSEMDKKLANIENQVNEVQANVNRISKVTDLTEKDPKHGFKDSAEFFLSVRNFGMRNQMDEKLKKHVEISNAVGSDEHKTSVNTDGGFLIPPAFLPEVKSTSLEATQVDTGMFTTQIPMGATSISIPARVDKNHTSSVAGGITVNRQKEANAITSSKMSFEMITLTAEDLVGLSFATEKLLQFSPISLSAILNKGFTEAKIGKLNYERLWGTGIGEYLGIQNCPALTTIAKESAQSNDTIVGENIAKMRAACWGYGSAIWMVNQDCYEQLLKVNVGGSNSDIFLFNLETNTLLGRPVVFDENCATLGDRGDINLVNWSEYLEGTIGGVSFAESVHVRFDSAETAFRFMMYNAGAPWWSTQLTPKKSATKLSPFVTLAAR